MDKRSRGNSVFLGRVDYKKPQKQSVPQNLYNFLAKKSRNRCISFTSISFLKFFMSEKSPIKLAHRNGNPQTSELIEVRTQKLQNPRSFLWRTEPKYDNPIQWKMKVRLVINVNAWS